MMPCLILVKGAKKCNFFFSIMNMSVHLVYMNNLPWENEDAEIKMIKNRFDIDLFYNPDT